MVTRHVCAKVANGAALLKKCKFNKNVKIRTVDVNLAMNSNRPLIGVVILEFDTPPQRIAVLYLKRAWVWKKVVKVQLGGNLLDKKKLP